MTKSKPVLLLQKGGGENKYHLSKAVGRTMDYLGKKLKKYDTHEYYGEISLLLNKNNQYAIIYERQIPALSGPSGDETQLLLAGTDEEFKILQKDSLEELTLNAALTEARRIAKKEGLVVRKKT